MTKEEVYELARKRYADPAVIFLNGECILGYWVKKEEVPPMDLMFTCESQGVVLVARAASWEAVAELAGLGAKTNARAKIQTKVKKKP
jgi:hypothetical protein